MFPHLFTSLAAYKHSHVTEVVNVFKTTILKIAMTVRWYKAYPCHSNTWCFRVFHLESVLPVKLVSPSRVTGTEETSEAIADKYPHHAVHFCSKLACHLTYEVKTRSKWFSPEVNYPNDSEWIANHMLLSRLKKIKEPIQMSESQRTHASSEQPPKLPNTRRCLLRWCH